MNKRFFSTLLLSLALVAAFTLTAAARQAPPAKVTELARAYFRELPADNNIITVDKLFSMMKAGEKMILVDVRKPADYRKSHLKGAVNLSFFDMSVPEALDKLPDDIPIMVNCYTGQTSSQVTALLNIAGKKAKNIESGFNKGISKAKGHEAMLEQTANALPQKTFAVDPDVKNAIAAYFKEKMALDGTPFAKFNLTAKSVKGIVDEENDEYLVVSVSRAEDYAKGHIPAALNLPFGRGMEKGLAVLPGNKKIAIYSDSGQRSSQATAVLRLMGYEAYSMSGGMNAWIKEGFPVKAN